jgi:hypothetical protein
MADEPKDYGIKKVPEPADQEPEVYRIEQGMDGSGFSRRRLLSAVAAAGTAASAACAHAQRKRRIRQMSRKTLTVPCGTPIPKDAVCICNCVAADIRYHGSEMVCTCDTVEVAAGGAVPAGSTCTCDLVCTCNTVGGSRGGGGTGGGGGHYWYPN